MDPLENEVAFFDSHRQEWLKHYGGKFVLVKNQELLGVYDSPTDAYQEGLKRFGNTPFLIKQVLKDEPTESIPSLNLGILHAGP